MELAGLNKEDLRARVQSCHVALLLLPVVTWEDARCESLIREDLLREDLLREGFLRQDPLMPGCTFLVPKQVPFVCVCALLILHSKISLCFKSSGCQNQTNICPVEFRTAEHPPRDTGREFEREPSTLTLSESRAPKAPSTRRDTLLAVVFLFQTKFQMVGHKGPCLASALGFRWSAPPSKCNRAMLRCCCCLLLHAMTRAARASSHLVWDAQTSVWALASFQTCKPRCVNMLRI